ncbi:MAG: hypothetical protein ACE5IG_04375 [Dehalococcoidia bacterium]
MVQTVAITILNPTAGPATGRVHLAPRMESLDGKVLGAIWNSRPHGDKILRMVIDLLRERFEIKEVLFRRKPYLGNMAPQEMYDEFAQKCDVVITGVGD